MKIFSHEKDIIYGRVKCYCRATVKVISFYCPYQGWTHTDPMIEPHMKRGIPCGYSGNTFDSYHNFSTYGGPELQ